MDWTAGSGAAGEEREALKMTLRLGLSDRGTVVVRSFSPVTHQQVGPADEDTGLERCLRF